ATIPLDYGAYVRKHSRWGLVQDPPGFHFPLFQTYFEAFFLGILDFSKFRPGRQDLELGDYEMYGAPTNPMVGRCGQPNENFWCSFGVAISSLARRARGGTFFFPYCIYIFMYIPLSLSLISLYISIHLSL